MAMMFLIGVPISLLAGFAFHRTWSSTRITKNPPPKLRQRLVAVGLPLICLCVWVGLCVAVKLLTWKPFAGDTPGSVELTNVLLVAGAVLAGVWMSVRLEQHR